MIQEQTLAEKREEKEYPTPALPFEGAGIILSLLGLLILLLILLFSYNFIKETIADILSTVGNIISGGAVSLAAVAVKVGESISDVAVFFVNTTSTIIVSIVNVVATVATALIAALIAISNQLAISFGPILVSMGGIAVEILAEIGNLIATLLEAINAAMFGGFVDPFGFVPGIFQILQPLFDLFG